MWELVICLSRRDGARLSDVERPLPWLSHPLASIADRAHSGDRVNSKGTGVVPIAQEPLAGPFVTPEAPSKGDWARLISMTAAAPKMT